MVTGALLSIRQPNGGASHRWKCRPLRAASSANARESLETFATPTKPEDWDASASDFSFRPSVGASTACPLYPKQHPAVEQSALVSDLPLRVRKQFGRPRCGPN